MRDSSHKTDESHSVYKDFVQLAKIALTANEHDVQLFIRRMARRYRESAPELAAGLVSLMQSSPTRMSPLRKEGPPAVPVDNDSRLQLLRIEESPHLDIEPVYPAEVESVLRLMVRERAEVDRLTDAGLEPTRTLLFTGAPGVGKSLAARWLARELGIPLLVLDLSAVMSSFLGRTGNNLRQVMEYAKGLECVLLLDELDAVAKRRDDSTEVGELKRLVTVLLQEIDSWPSRGIIVAATNHAGLLDPAVWRRFERQVEFPMPDALTLERAVERFLGPDSNTATGWTRALAVALQGASFSDAERLVTGARRAAAVEGTALSHWLTKVVRDRSGALGRAARTELALKLVALGAASQREAYDLTGVSRDTIRKLSKQGDSTDEPTGA